MTGGRPMARYPVPVYCSCGHCVAVLENPFAGGPMRVRCGRCRSYVSIGEEGVSVSVTVEERRERERRTR
jgi:hypothetical protein